MKTSRVQPGSIRKKELLDAGQRLFLTKGIGRTSVEDITKAAAVSKGSFYLHFPSKEALLVALEARFGEEQRIKLEAAIARVSDGNLVEKLEAWVVAAVDSFCGMSELHDLIFYGSRPASREDLSTNELVAHLSGLLTQGSKAKAWTLTDPWQTAVFLYGGLHEMVGEAIQGKRSNPKQLKKDLSNLFKKVLL